jgi:transcriptional regulator with XRE-family HTH domain
MAERRAPKRGLHHDPESVTWAREQLGLTMTELADKVGVSLSLISEIEKGTRNATPKMILRLAGALRTPASELRTKTRRRPTPVTETAGTGENARQAA